MTQLDVLIPHYNDPAGLALSLRSVAQQSWKGDLRVVIADDGSAAKALAEVEALSERHAGKVTLLRHSTNRGRPYMRNALLDALESPYAAWLDAGDEWLPNKIEAQFADLKRLETSGPSAWITCNSYRQTQRSRKNLPQLTGSDPIQKLLAGKLHPHLWTLLARSKSFLDVGRFDERLSRSQDFDFFLRYLLQGGKIQICSNRQPLCIHHFTHGKYGPEMVRSCTQHILQKHHLTYERMGKRYVKQRLYKQELACARYAAAHLQIGQELLYVSRLFRLKPLHTVRYVLRRLASCVSSITGLAPSSLPDTGCNGTARRTHSALQ